MQASSPAVAPSSLGMAASPPKQLEEVLSSIAGAVEDVMPCSSVDAFYSSSYFAHANVSLCGTSGIFAQSSPFCSSMIFPSLPLGYGCREPSRLRAGSYNMAATPIC